MAKDQLKYNLSMSFKVTSVIDGDTFDVSPSWKWKMNSGETATGERVRIAGFDAPETGTLAGNFATAQLKNLIEGKDVELRKAVSLSYGRIVCEVFLNGTNIANHLN